MTRRSSRRPTRYAACPRLSLVVRPSIRDQLPLMTNTARSAFRMPRPVKITGRTSTITNSFVNGIIPVVEPTDDEILSVLRGLEMDAVDVRCAYCGDPSTEWDHLEPIVSNKRPTGYISEIANLVPACGKCNQSKSGRPWRDWIQGPAARSPKTRGIQDLEERIERLERFEAIHSRRIIDFEAVVPSDLWDAHWRNHDELHRMMDKSQETAEQVRDAAKHAIQV